MKKEANWEVYIIESESGHLYTGITNDLDRRFESHLSGRKGARFFRISKPSKILYRESHPDRSSATKREIEIKKLTRQQKIFLIQA